MHEGVLKRLAADGLALPVPAAPAGDYVPAVRVGGFVQTSGQLPVVDGALEVVGRVGAEVEPHTAVECAKVAALNALAAASTVCDLDDVVSVVKVTCYVASAAEFTAQPAIANGASAVLVAAFGDVGRHAREAVGVAALPLGAPVEVSVLLAVR